MKTAYLVCAFICACRSPAPSSVVPDAAADRPPMQNQHEGSHPPQLQGADADNSNKPKLEHLTALRRQLCVTEGAFVDSRELAVKASKMRCVQADSAGERAKLRFRYEGTSLQRTALKSGAVREQLGLKLKARDGCNLVYVMWRFLPQASVVVSFKDNPSDTSHAECENNGYTNLRPEKKLAPPEVALGNEYELRAEIKGDLLEAWIDDRLVWRGKLPDAAVQLSGPSGFRSDNVQWTLLDFDGSSPGAPPVKRAALPICRNPG